MSGGEERDGVTLTNLDQPLFDGAGATKRDLVDYLDAMRDRVIPGLAGRPLSVIRVLRGQAPFMQKNVPKYTPEWVPTVRLWAETSRRQVSYALCDDRRTLLWFANQRAVEYHPTLVTAEHWDRPTHLILDLDPPEADAAGAAGFGLAVRAAFLIRQALADSGLAGAVKTSGAKGVHVFVPIDTSDTAAPVEDVAAATRALAARAERLDPELATTAFIREDRGGRVFLDSTRAGGATVVAAYSPRVRPGAPVSFPVSWDDLDRVAPADFTVRNAAALAGDGDPWAAAMPAPQALPADLIEEGRQIPIARVQAMHEGKRWPEPGAKRRTAARSNRHTEAMPADHDALAALVAIMPFAGRLGMTLAEAGPDRVVAQLDWAPDLCTAAGILHGGVLMSLADSAGALVAYLGLPEGKSTATITSTTQMFRPVTSGAVQAVAVPLHRGRSTVTVQASLHDEAGRLVAQTTQVQAIR